MNKRIKSENGQRNERFGWIFSEWTIGLVLVVTVLPAVVHGVLSLNNLPIV